MLHQYSQTAVNECSEHSTGEIKSFSNSIFRDFPLSLTRSPLFCVRSTEMCEEEQEEEEVEASGERQNSSGGFSVREK